MTANGVWLVYGNVRTLQYDLQKSHHLRYFYIQLVTRFSLEQ